VEIDQGQESSSQGVNWGLQLWPTLLQQWREREGGLAQAFTLGVSRCKLQARSDHRLKSRLGDRELTASKSRLSATLKTRLEMTL
jgi:hypothetical protein